MMEFSIVMNDEPGALASHCEAIAANGANILAIAGVGSDDARIAVITDNEDATRLALNMMSANYTTSSVHTQELPHKPGALAEFCREMGDSGTNMRSLYILNMGEKSATIGYTTDDN
jgi:hypothetical protein